MGQSYDRRFPSDWMGHIVVCIAAATFSLPAAAWAAPAAQSYQVELVPLNASVGGGGHGTATLTITGDTLTIEAKVQHLSPGMHMIHIHGFPSGDKAATCATAAQDTNKDGIIDLNETGPVSGTTLIPFDSEPVTLKIASDTYPKADTAGAFQYRASVSVPQLDAALKKQFGIDGLQLDRRVIYVHGVPASSNLPATVKSLPGVPAYLTLPVACGIIRAVN